MPVYHEDAVFDEGMTTLKVAGKELMFNTANKQPVLPLRAFGALSHLNWDIETQYAIDYSGQCWMDFAHGGPMDAKEPGDLISAAADMGEAKQNELRRLLGLPLEFQWQKIARAHGWTPPKIT